MINFISNHLNLNYHNIIKPMQILNIIKQIGFPKQVIFEKTLKNMYSIGITYVSQ